MEVGRAKAALLLPLVSKLLGRPCEKGSDTYVNGILKVSLLVMTGGAVEIEEFFKGCLRLRGQAGTERAHCAAFSVLYFRRGPWTSARLCMTLGLPLLDQCRSPMDPYYVALLYSGSQ